MTNHNLQTYSDMWSSPNDWILGPVNWIDDSRWYGDAKYAPYKKKPLTYMPFSLPSDIAEIIVEKMIDAGVEILDRIPIETREERYQHMWADRKDEFVLCRADIAGKYLFCHKPTQEMVLVHNHLQDWCIENMLKVGVEIWDERPT